MDWIIKVSVNISYGTHVETTVFTVVRDARSSYQKIKQTIKLSFIHNCAIKGYYLDHKIQYVNRLKTKETF